MQPQFDVVDTIASLSLFADLSRAQLEAVTHVFEEASFGQGERILRQGLSGSNFFVILDGDVAIRIDGQDRATLSRGDFFGELSVLRNKIHSKSAEAVGDCEIMVLPRNSFERLVESDEELAEQVRRQGIARIEGTA